MVFFGTKQVQRPLPGQHKVCPVCLSVTEHTVTENGTYFTLYFIPLFPLKREVVYTCNQCGESYAVPYDEYQAEHAPEEAKKHAHSNTEGGAGKQSKSTRDKARLILEGKVVNGKVKDLRIPFQISSRHIYLGLWVTLGLVTLVAAALIILLYSVLAR